MNDEPALASAPTLDAKAIADLAEQLSQLLRLRTLPIGMRGFADLEAMANVPGLRRPPRGKTFSTCQLVTQARMAGFTLGITTENVPEFSSCSSVIGLDAPGEIYTSGRKMEGVWFENRDAAAAHQAGMSRVAPGTYQGMVVSPLRSARLDPPDICLFYGNPAQMILFINGLQWKNYQRYDFSITGESACADSWGHALKTRKVSLSIPCYAERRYGGVADDEMLMACPPEDLQRAVTGLQGLSKAGLRYPIMPFGPQAEPGEGMAKSYAGKRKLQQERGTDVTIFSPRAAGMGHHLGDASTSEAWSAACNELIHRVCTLFPRNFVGVCMLPQSARVSPKNCVAELERCVNEYGFIGCNLNPDPSGGYWQDPPLGDRYWYPIYEKMVELDVPAMIHVSQACNPAFHTTGSHYLNGDTAAFMQCLTSDLFKNFPTLKFIIPHGGGAVPYHWGRFRGIAQDMKLPPLSELLLRNIFFDTCVYHLPGQELLAKVIPAENILFASEMIGAVRGIDPETGFPYDDTKRYVEQLPLPPADKQKIYEGNARRVFSRLSARLG